MKTLSDWIRHHQLISFFVLTFTISWGLLISFGPIYFSGVVLVAPLLVLSLFGPALAGIIVSGVVRPQPKKREPKKRLLSFLLTWLVATPVFLSSPPPSPAPAGISLGFVVVAAVTALIPAFIVSSAFSATPGVRKCLESLAKPSGSVVWYIVAIFIVPALLGLSILIATLLGSDIPPPRETSDGPWAALVWLLILALAYRFFYANACGEEPGWRGFALPRLQALYSPLTANLILAFFWAAWHLPLPQAQGLVNPMAFLEYYIGTLAHCIIIAWLFNHTRGSILVAGLVHVSSNVSRLFIPETAEFAFVRPMFCIVLIVIYRMWKRLPAGSGAVYREEGAH
jgi:membrane protease YdiL (CAAX protease family)